jgi:hypothetical protein
MLRYLLILADWVVLGLQAQAARLRKQGDKFEDDAVVLYTLASEAEHQAKLARNEASRVQRVAQKLGGALK